MAGALVSGACALLGVSTWIVACETSPAIPLSFCHSCSSGVQNIVSQCDKFVFTHQFLNDLFRCCAQQQDNWLMWLVADSSFLRLSFGAFSKHEGSFLPLARQRRIDRLLRLTCLRYSLASRQMATHLRVSNGYRFCASARRRRHSRARSHRPMLPLQSATIHRPPAALFPFGSKKKCLIRTCAIL